MADPTPTPAPSLTAVAQGGTPIRYIGTKPKKSDNVCGTDTVWDGHGDIQYVSQAVAAKLLAPRFRDIWQHAEQAVPDPRDKVTRVASNAARAAKAHIEKQSTNPKGTVDPEVRVPLEEIIDGVCQLMEMADNVKFLNEDGSPKLEAVRERLGKKIGQAQLNDAWAQLMAT